MQLTQVIYNLLLRHTVVMVMLMFVLVNALLYQTFNKQHEQNLQAQHKFIEHLTDYYLPIEDVSALSDSILAWYLTDRHGDEIANKRYGQSWSMAETSYHLGNGELIIRHKTILSDYFSFFLGANTALLLCTFLVVGFSHINLYKHWKILIQLEAWASRYSRNSRFKFYIKTKNYHLVNAIRNLNQARIDAQKHGQQAAHFIRSQTFLDKTTGLGNRLYFENRLDAVLQRDDKVYGAVLLVHYGVLDTIRENEGKEASIDYLHEFSNILKVYLDDTAQSVVSRISSNDFAILLPYIDGKEVEKIALSILRKSQKISLPEYTLNEPVVHIGADMYGMEDSSFQIMAEADMALRAAQLHGPSGWFMYDSGQLPASEIRGSVRWRTTIQNALDSDNFVLCYQPVVDNVMRVHHQEVLARMVTTTGDVISANVFFPMAKKCGLIPEIDKKILVNIAKVLNEKQLTPISVNIHIDSWLDRDFCNWLIRFLKANSYIASFIIFEISEYELAQHGKKLASVFNAVKRYNVQLMVDQVGLYVVDTDYLDTVAIHYLKLHQSIVNQIDKRSENQMFIRSLQSVVTNKDILIFAMGVEAEAEVQTLRRLSVAGMQGHFIKSPSDQLLAATDQVDIDSEIFDL